MTKEELRQQAAISILNSLLETTQHSVIEALAVKDLYAHTAVLYADALVSALDKSSFEIKNWLDVKKLVEPTIEEKAVK